MRKDVAALGLLKDDGDVVYGSVRDDTMRGMYGAVVGGLGSLLTGRAIFQGPARGGTRNR